MASFKQNIPTSLLIKQGAATGDIDEKRTKGEYRRQKDLEEARKAGDAQALIDVDSGRDINPHIPMFIAQTPWYVPSDGPTLKHQRPHAERVKELASMDQWYKKGTTGQSATKFRKGACENCGAMGHQKKDCFDRPRKMTAKFTGEDIQEDDHVQDEFRMDFDAKRDRWNGYDPRAHQKVIDEFEQMEETRKLIKAEKIKAGLMNEGEDDEKYADDADMAGVEVDMDSRTRITVRNLRIREDTAKYLYNLSENAPHYDPKSRSMRENPFAGLPGKEKEAAKFAGENFVRYTGEVVAANEAQVFAWNARRQGIDIHAIAEPTKLETMKKEYMSVKETEASKANKELLEKYGGGEHLAAPPKELLLAQTERYVEYSRKGNIVKGEERPRVKSKYEEDIYPGNHTSIFGSYWKEGQWGYACCHSFIKNSYCVGEEGKKNVTLSLGAPAAFKKNSTNEPEPVKQEAKEPEKQPKIEEEEESSSFSSSSSSSDSESDSEDKEEEMKQEKEKREKEEKRRAKKREKRRRQKEKKSKEGHSRKRKVSSSSSSDSEESDDDKKKLKAAIKKARKDQAEGNKMAKIDDRDRKYNNYDQGDHKPPTEIEMEAFNLTRIHSADPMAAYMQEKRDKKKK